MSKEFKKADLQMLGDGMTSDEMVPESKAASSPKSADGEVEHDANII